MQIRIQETQKETVALRAKLGPNAAGGRKSKHLLSGLMKCGECGGNFIAADTRTYQCSANKQGGKHACKNGIRVKREIAEARILEDIENELLSDGAISHFCKEIVRLVKERKRGLASEKSDQPFARNSLELIGN